jgi:hypothetical protein
MPLLKVTAQNINPKLLFETFHPEIFGLNADAPKNIRSMLVTFETSHPVIYQGSFLIFEQVHAGEPRRP